MVPYVCYRVTYCFNLLRVCGPFLSVTGLGLCTNFLVVDVNEFGKCMRDEINSGVGEKPFFKSIKDVSRYMMAAVNK